MRAVKVLVCGSRLFDMENGQRRVRDRLGQLPRDVLIITGGAGGPDEFARRWAVDSSVDHLIRYADWQIYGKRAGIIRNLRMLDEQPDLVIAFWDGQSRGTKHTIEEARRRGIPVEVIT